jgi:regulator of sirC expression with transglutaminase-like and TPR domain
MDGPITPLDYFRTLVGDAGPIPLFEAAASIALDAYPKLDLQATLADLDRLAQRLATECRGAETETARLQRTLRFFFGTLGFEGNAQDYYAPDNSYLHRVMATRRGIPITLAVLFAELARQVGLDVQGVAFPGHFLLRVNVSQGMAVIDPFTGSSLDMDELERRAAPHGVRAAALLRPATERQILIRMLSNLRAIQSARGRTDLLEKIDARLRIVQAPPGGLARTDR